MFGVELDTPEAAVSDDEVKIEKSKPGKRKPKAVIEKESEVMPTASKKRKSKEALSELPEKEEEEAPVIAESKTKRNQLRDNRKLQQRRVRLLQPNLMILKKNIALT